MAKTDKTKGRPAISRFFINRIEELAEQGLRPPTIVQRLHTYAEDFGIAEKVPSERTIRRYFTEYMQLPAEKRRDNRPFQWPDGMGEAGIPWEDSRIVFELLMSEAKKGRLAPTAGMVTWFWRVTHASPDLDLSDRVYAAELLKLTDGSQSAWDTKLRTAVSSYLMFAPWRWQDEEATALATTLLVANGLEPAVQLPLPLRLFDFTLLVGSAVYDS